MRRVLGAAVWACVLILGCSSAPPRTPAGVEQQSPPLKAANDTQKRWLEIYNSVAGRPYQSGGTSRKGFDCSGLVQYAYRNFDGRALPRTTRDLFRLGESVDRMRPGDLVFYGAKNKPTHVGIYFWNHWFLHAAREGVILSSTHERYYAERFLGARRLP